MARVPATPASASASASAPQCPSTLLLTLLLLTQIPVIISDVLAFGHLSTKFAVLGLLIASCACTAFATVTVVKIIVQKSADRLSVAQFCASCCLAAIIKLVQEALTSQGDLLIANLIYRESFPSVAQTVLMMAPVVLTVIFPAHRVCTMWVLFFSYGALLVCSLVSPEASLAPLQLINCAMYSGIVWSATCPNRHVAVDTFSADNHHSPQVEPESVPESVRGAIVGVAPEVGVHDMVANVAHDLKTPLSSFTMGVEHIGTMLRDCKLHLEGSPQVNKPKLLSALEAIGDSIDRMRTTNIFMVMGINRLQDCAKASRGLQLVPQNDTINLVEALSLPLTCMENIQTAVQIELEQLPKEICSFIITDKHWLQENLLCLLSNAEKYSNGGQVVVRVLLENEGREARDGERASDSSVGVGSCAESAAVSTAQMSLIRGFTARVFPLDATFPSHALSPPIVRTISTRSAESEAPAMVALRFEVEDHGVGMSDQARESLFSPFCQAQRMAGGTGLGLFSLSLRVEALHGKCGVERRRDGQQGSRFWFTIPYRAGLSVDDTENTSVHMSVSTVDLRTPIFRGIAPLSPDLSVSTRSVSPRAVNMAPLTPRAPTPLDPNLRTVLLVDDSPVVRTLSVSILNRMGFQVKVATNGGLALEAIEAALCSMPLECDCQPRAAFDVILMDLQMPVMDGLEATRRLRNWESNRCTPSGLRLAQSVRHVVVGLSANNEQDVERDIQEAGFDSFIPKPLYQKALLDCLAGLGM